MSGSTSTRPNIEKARIVVRTAIQQWHAGDASALERCAALLQGAIDDLSLVETIGKSHPPALFPYAPALLDLKRSIREFEEMYDVAAVIIRGGSGSAGSSIYSASGCADFSADPTPAGVEA